MRNVIVVGFICALAACTGEMGPAGQNGQNGQNGQDGVSPAIRRVAEGPGSNCFFGGTRVEWGRDINNSGELDEDEVASGVLMYECDSAIPSGTCDTLHGNLIVHNSLDLMLFRQLGCTAIDGSLIIDGKVASLEGLEFLKTVSGGINFNSATTDLLFAELPALEYVGTLYVIQTPIQEFKAPRLRAVGDLRVSSNADLRSLDMPLLEEATYLFVHNNPKLPTCQVEELKERLGITGTELGNMQDECSK